jgi:predicted transporter
MKWVPYASVVAGACQLVSSSIVFATDGDEPGVSVALYFLGVALAIAVAIGFGMSRRPGRRALVAVAGSLLVVARIMALGDQLTPVFEVFSKKEYVGNEGPLVLMGLVLIGLGARAGRSSEPVPA